VANKQPNTTNPHLQEFHSAFPQSEATEDLC